MIIIFILCCTCICTAQHSAVHLLANLCGVCVLSPPTYDSPGTVKTFCIRCGTTAGLLCGPIYKKIYNFQGKQNFVWTTDYSCMLVVYKPVQPVMSMVTSISTGESLLFITSKIINCLVAPCRRKRASQKCKAHPLIMTNL